MFNQLMHLLGYSGLPSEYTFRVKVYSARNNLDKDFKVSDSYSLTRIFDDDNTYEDMNEYFYFKSLPMEGVSASFTLIFKRSELNDIPRHEFKDFLGVVAHNTNQSLMREVPPYATDWESRWKNSYQPFSFN